MSAPFVGAEPPGTTSSLLRALRTELGVSLEVVSTATRRDREIRR